MISPGYLDVFFFNKNYYFRVQTFLLGKLNVSNDIRQALIKPRLFRFFFYKKYYFRIQTFLLDKHKKLNKKILIDRLMSACFCLDRENH